jgi:hypothetical protein
MKKTVVMALVAMVATACSSSKKETPNSLPERSITIISPKHGETFRAGQYVTVKWRSNNLPKGTLIELQLENYTGKKIVLGELVPQTIAYSHHDCYPAANCGAEYYTANDGEEVVQIPPDTSFYGKSLYHRPELNASYGKTFKLSLNAITPALLAFFTTGQTPSTVEGPISDSSKDFFAIVPH